MAVILERLDQWVLRLGHVVATARRALKRHGGGQEHRPAIEIKGDAALQVEGVARIGSGGEIHRAPAACRSGGNGAVDRRRIDRHAVPPGAEVAHIEKPRRQQRRGGFGERRGQRLGMRPGGGKAEKPGSSDYQTATIQHVSNPDIWWVDSISIRNTIPGAPYPIFQADLRRRGCLYRHVDIYAEAPPVFVQGCKADFAPIRRRRGPGRRPALHRLDNLMQRFPARFYRRHGDR